MRNTWTALTGLLLGVASAMTASDPTSDERYLQLEYLNFVSKYSKTYASLQHLDERYNVFKENYLKIASHNSHIDEYGRPAPFRMAVNKFSDMTETEFANERLRFKAAAAHKQNRTQGDAGQKAKLRSIKQLDRDGRPMAKQEQQDDGAVFNK